MPLPPVAGPEKLGEEGIAAVARRVERGGWRRLGLLMDLEVGAEDW